MILIKVDEDICTCCELCYDRLPQVFSDRGDGVAIVRNYNQKLIRELLEEIKEVAEECPADSITIETEEN